MPPENTDVENDAADPFGLCGETIQGKYRINAVVGTGGFGVVYRGVHTGFGEPIAVKCLKLPSELDESERDELLTRLQDEGRVLHRLSKLSSGIVQALDVGAVTTPKGQWVPYLVLEWLEGETLAEHLRRRREGDDPPYKLEHAVRLLEPAARALAVAHRQKVAHRDVKPENLVLLRVSGEQTIKVLDFGIAKVLTQHSTFTAAPAATQKNPTAFTPGYGAPEQFNKKRGATGPWTDVFALGLILVEMVTGERALVGDDATQLYIAAADPAARPTPRYHGVELGDAVEEVMDRALAIEPADRFPDAGMFWDALRKAIGASIPPDDSLAFDTSSTGEFVSKHDVGIDPASLASPDAEGEPARRQTPPPTMVEGRATARSREEDDEGDEPSPPIRPRTRAPSSERPPPPAHLTQTQVPAASPRWLPFVGILAIVGAGVLYWQLRSMDRPSPIPGLDGSASVPKPRPRPGGKRPARPGSTPPVVGAGGGGGHGGGAGGSGGAGGAGGGAPETPPGMVRIAPPGDGAPFYIDATEVTLGAYLDCVAQSGGQCEEPNRVVLEARAAKVLLGVDGGDPEALEQSWQKQCNLQRDQKQDPVNCVKHRSAEGYCRFVGKRLPTESEWRVAALGEGRAFPWGDGAPTCDDACFAKNGVCYPRGGALTTCSTLDVGRDQTIEGVMGMYGNVSEWVAGGGGEKVMMGGSFFDDAEDLTGATRRSMPATTAFVSIGFRCAMDAPSTDEDEPTTP